MERLDFYYKGKINMDDSHNKKLWDSSTNFIDHVSEGIRTLDKGIEILRKVGLKPWASAGTALGLVRDYTFIRHDTDIDLEAFIRNPSVDLTNSILNELKINGFEPIRTVFYGNTKEMPMQIATVGADKIILDYYFYYQNPLKEDQLVNFTDSGVMFIDTKLLYNMDIALSLWGTKYPVPGPREDYMVFRYGEDWEKPKKKKTLWWDECPCLIRHNVAEVEYNKKFRK